MDIAQQTARVISYSKNYWESYSEFARYAWGNNCYQATSQYINWLYEECPSFDKNPTDFLIAVNSSDKVVGCIHKLRIPWLLHNNAIEIPTIHNLFVNKLYRSSVGLPLIIKALIAGEYGVVPGAAPPVDEIYQKLKCQPVKIKRYRKILRPLAGTFHLLKSKLTGNLNYKYFSDDKIIQRQSIVNITLMPTDNELTKLATTLANRQAKYTLSPHWDLNWLKWRFFHKQGPRHLLIYVDLPQSSEIDFMILSLGTRHNLNVGRIVELSVSDSANFQQLLAVAESISKQNEAHINFAYGLDSELDSLFTGTGWRCVENPAKTFFYHKNKSRQFTSYCITPACFDMGFEAIMV